MKFWKSVKQFALVLWTIKFRLMLLFLIGLAVYAHYREYEGILPAIFNGIGVLALSVVGSLAWGEGHD